MSIAEINYLRCTRWRARQLGGNRRQLLATLFSQYPRFWTPDPESRPRVWYTQAGERSIAG